MGKQPRVVDRQQAPAAVRVPRPDARADRGRSAAPDAGFADRDCVLVLDTGTWNQLGDFGRVPQGVAAAAGRGRPPPHPGRPRRPPVRGHRRRRRPAGWLTRSSRPSACRSPRTPPHHLFMALAHDTGWFRHPNTTPATFALAETLVAAGADPTAAVRAAVRVDAAWPASGSRAGCWSGCRRGPAGGSRSPRCTWPTTRPRGGAGRHRGPDQLPAERRGRGGGAAVHRAAGGRHEGELPVAGRRTCRSWPRRSAAAATGRLPGPGGGRLPTARDAVLAAVREAVLSGD